MFGSLSRQDHFRLIEEGEAADAVVLEARTVGIGGAPLRFSKTYGGLRTGTNAVDLHIRVQPTGGEPYEVKRRMRMPEHTPRDPGDHVKVIFDPADPEKLIVDPDSWAHVEGEHLG
jgi:hypothetical protein